jgi:hypothetical protein
LTWEFPFHSLGWRPTVARSLFVARYVVQLAVQLAVQCVARYVVQCVVVLGPRRSTRTMMQGWGVGSSPFEADAQEEDMDIEADGHRDGAVHNAGRLGDIAAIEDLATSYA